MEFADYEIPVAHSMVRMATQFGECFHPLEEFTFYWAAFNNIYFTIAAQQGRRPRRRTNADGSIRTRKVGQVSIPEMNAVPERKQIDLAFQQFTDELKRHMVEHETTRFFVYRTPMWRGQPIARDANGQRLNGVLNVNYTIDAEHPVWAPIDVQAFEEYQRGMRDRSRRDALARQILGLLYTVRNNTFHGAKSPDDENDREVLEKAVPLLAMIVNSFVNPCAFSAPLPPLKHSRPRRKPGPGRLRSSRRGCRFAAA